MVTKTQKILLSHEPYMFNFGGALLPYAHRPIFYHEMPIANATSRVTNILMGLPMTRFNTHVA